MIYQEVVLECMNRHDALKSGQKWMMSTTSEKNTSDDIKGDVKDLKNR